MLQANLQLQEQVGQLNAARNVLAEAAEAHEDKLFELQAQIDLLNNHASESEAWLTTM